MKLVAGGVRATPSESKSRALRPKKSPFKRTQNKGSLEDKGIVFGRCAVRYRLGACVSHVIDSLG